MSVNLVFVYGTLRPGAHENAAAAQLADQAEHVGPAWMQGRLYRISYFPGLSLSDDPSEQVRGDLFLLPEGSDLIAVLDGWERYDPERPGEGDYRRELCEVQSPHGPLTAWVYLYQAPLEGAAHIPSGDFLECAPNTG